MDEMIDDKYQLISNLESLNIYQLDTKLTNNYEDYELITKLLKTTPTISKLTNFIKKFNTPNIFYLLLHMLPYPTLIKWYYELNVMKYYWNDKIINDIIDNNLLSLKINYLNKDYETGYKNLILLNNQFNLHFNFFDDIFKRRFTIIKNIMESNGLDSNVIYGADVVSLVGSNNFNDLIKNKITITIFTDKQIKFNCKTNLRYKCPYYYLEQNNVVFRIYEYIADIHKITMLSINDATYDYINDKLYCNAKYYQILHSPINSICYIPETTMSVYSISPAINDVISNYGINNCYICKKAFDPKLFIDVYDNLCVQCAKENYINKNLCANLSGNTYLITGGRVKIGFATALKLLRMNAKVIITTRYPNFALMNYQSEYDYEIWKDNFTIIECDFTKLTQIYAMLKLLENYQINGIINNAFQTIKASDFYYDSVGKIETELKKNMITDESEQIRQNTDLILYNSQNQIVLYKPEISLSTFRDVIDVQHENSWNKKIDEISPEEIVEATLINQLVPTLLISKLKPVLIAPKFIINVTSLEGTFNHSKTDKHLHTNMCKSAMNMMIRTLAEDSDKDLHVYAINPGYVSGVCPQKDKYALSLEDGASRIIYPIVKYFINEPLNKEHVLLHNYKPADW